MKVGLIGFGSCGRSTLYRAAARGQAKGDVTAVPVPDERFDAIVAQVKPKKITPATVIFHDDFEPIQGGKGKLFSQRWLDDARKMDLLLHVVRAFESPMAPYYAEVDPIRDQSLIEDEILIEDLKIVESRLERLAKSLNARNPGHPEYLEKALFEKLKGPLESGTPIRAISLAEDEQTTARNFQFLTAKPMVVAFNLGESDAAAIPPSLAAKIAELEAKGIQGFTVCASIEDEVAQLDPVDQPEFLSALGLTQPAAIRVIQAIYRALGLITFFTAGENETRAWPLREGSTALKAASTIHTDIAKGFIRAEVVRYADYAACGSLDAAYSAGKMVLEGKDAIIQDGDLLHIRNKS